MRLGSRWYTEDQIKGISNQKTPHARPRHVPGKMNKTESAYAYFLDLRQKAGEIKRYAFEPIKFRLADKTFYTPDFMVVKETQIELHEIKGFWEDDARVKIKVVAEIFPEFLFIAVQKIKGEYNYEYFNCSGIDFNNLPF